jgi:hypothetical protein
MNIRMTTTAAAAASRATTRRATDRPEERDARRVRLRMLLLYPYSLIFPIFPLPHPQTTAQPAHANAQETRDTVPAPTPASHCLQGGSLVLLANDDGGAPPFSHLPIKRAWFNRELLEHQQMDGQAEEWENDLGFAITTRLELGA